MATDAAPPGPDRKPQRPPASTDVARLAGVSQKTVSRVMNGEPHVKDDVRERVLRAAAELGYRRNSAARALISGRTRRIGVVSLGTALFGPATVLVSFERAARRQGYALSLANTFEGDAGGISGALDELLEQGVDGIILSEPIDEGPLHLDVHVPVLVVGNYPGLTAPDVLHTSAAGHLSAPGRDRAPARPGPPDGAPRQRTGAVVLRPRPRARLAGGPGAGRRARATAPGGRLERGLRLRGRPGPRARTPR